MSGIKVKVRLVYLRKKNQATSMAQMEQAESIGSEVKGDGSRAYMAFSVLVASQDETLTDTLRIA